MVQNFNCDYLTENCLENMTIKKVEAQSSYVVYSEIFTMCPAVEEVVLHNEPWDDYEWSIFGEDPDWSDFSDAPSLRKLSVWAPHHFLTPPGCEVIQLS